jgi:hypothetical protein
MNGTQIILESQPCSTPCPTPTCWRSTTLLLITRFDTRANGVRRTEALLEAHGLTLAEASRLADVILPDDNASQEPPPDDDAVEPFIGDIGSGTGLDDDADPNQSLAAGSQDAERKEGDPRTTIRVDPHIALSVEAFVRELMKLARPAYIAAFLRRLDAGGAAPGSTTKKREGGMTTSQRKIVELCSRPEGATGKELAEGCGWPSIAARATCQKLADRFGYGLHENPKSNGRGISFRMAAKPAAEEQA